jgi:protease IV
MGGVRAGQGKGRRAVGGTSPRPPGQASRARPVHQGSRLAWALVLASWGPGAEGVGWAQTAPAGVVVDSEDAVTRGVFVPDGARSGEPNATAVELNPAQLAFLRAAGISALVDASADDVRLSGRGAGLFLATPLWSGSAVGTSLQWVGGNTLGNGFELPTGRTKLQLAYGMGGRHLALGISWSHLWGDTVGGIDTFDVGAGVRLADRLALGLVVEDLGRPSLGSTIAAGGVIIPGVTLRRRWVAEVTVRPTGTDRVNLAVAALHVEDDRWSQPWWRLRGSVRAASAVRFFADATVGPHRIPANPAATAFVDDGYDLRLTFGLGIDFSHATVELAVRQATVPDGSSGAGSGVSAAVHQSGERTETTLAPAEMARVELGDLGADRAFLERVLALRAMAFDPALAGVWLEIADLELGPGRIEELRDVVAELRRHGKRVVAALTSPSMRDVYLAAACDRIVIHPAGTLTFSGVAQSATFFKGAMDRLGVRVDLVRIAEFKGAMEPFVFEQQSEPVRRNRNDLIADVFGRMTQQIAAGRGWDATRRAPAYLASLLAKAELTPEEALRAGLVDAVLDTYGREAFLHDWFGHDVAVRDADDSPVRPARWWRPRVAVVLVDGAIDDGDSRQLPGGMGGLAGEDTIVDALDRCRRDGSIRAVVLRINSPGGSAYASDVIARAVAKLRAAGKPVVASMGDVAASGGYYVAAPSSEIMAEPSTITGSIGIYGFKIDVSGLLGKLGLNTEVYRRGEHADELAPYRPWTDEERRIATGQLQHLYQLFLKTVADGRGARGLATPERVNEIGRGHVWSGAEGQRLGLVDGFGGFTAAVDRAADLAGLRRLTGEDPELVVLPRPSGSLVKRLIGLGQVAAASPDSVDAAEPEARSDDRAGDGAGGDGRGMAAWPISRWPGVGPLLRWAAPYLFGRGAGFEARLPPEDFDLGWP